MNQKSASLSSLALQKFKKNFWGVFSLGYIILGGLIAIFAYLVAPDNTKNANQMHVSIHSQSPGFEVQLLTIPGVATEEQSFLDKTFFGIRSQDTELPIAGFRVTNEALYIKEYMPNGLSEIEKVFTPEMLGVTSNFKESAQALISTKKFVLGTDKYGRDLLSRILVGMRISFFIGFIAVFISLLIGINLGAIAGYYGGKIDAAIMWIINITWSIPTLLLVIAITLALGKGFWQVFIAVGLTMWVEVARVVRGQVISVKEKQYITAARALGYKDFRIIFKHILPNIMAPVIVISAANFAAAILIESGLSFLGIGAQPPMPSWGAMIKDHYSYIILGKPYLAVIPGLAIMSLVLSFMLIGNALRDALDVKAN
ncbi:MAG: ABC transporter permease [Flavobacteriaceae bacterium]|nr:ABC transporter permease [Flavobacteriaceae bacterium]